MLGLRFSSSATAAGPNTTPHINTPSHLIIHIRSLFNKLFINQHLQSRQQHDNKIARHDHSIF
jgi:hypothetical protein